MSLNTTKSRANASFTGVYNININHEISHKRAKMYINKVL